MSKQAVARMPNVPVAPLVARASGRTALSKADIVAKIEALKQEFIAHPDVARIEEELDRLMLYGNLGSKMGSPSRCMLVTGPSGTGKSALLKRWSAQYPMESTPLGDKRAALYVELKENSTIKGLAEQMLLKLGVPWKPVSRASQVTLAELIKHHLREQQVQVVVLDEIQEIIESRGRHHAYKAADFLKGLLNESVCPFVLAGMPEATSIFAENKQLRRRSRAQLSLKAYDWYDPADRAYLRRFLVDYSKKLPFEQPSRLGENKGVALRIHHFAEGLIGRAIDFLVQACETALERNASCLTPEVLSDTVELHRETYDPKWFNPFMVAELEPLRLTPETDAGGREMRQGKRERQERPSDLMRS